MGKMVQQLGLLGLRIQRMATEPGREFDQPANYPYLTVASPSCHDVTPLRAWWVRIMAFGIRPGY